MHWVSFFTLACGVLTLLIGYRVYLLDNQNKIYRLFFGIASISAWVCFCWFEMSQTSNIDRAYYYLRLSNAWIFLFPLIFYLLWWFSGIKQQKIPAWVRFPVATIVFVPALLFFYFETFVTTNIQLIQMAGGQWGMTRDGNIQGVLLGVWLMFVDLLCIYFFYDFYKGGKNNKRLKRNALIMMVICFGGALIQTHLLPYLGIVVPINSSGLVLLGIGLFGWLVIGFNLSKLENGWGIEKVAKAMTNLLILTDNQFAIHKINPAALAFFGVNEKETLEKPLKYLMDQVTFDTIKTMTEDSKAEKDKEFVFKKGNELVYLLLSVSPILNHKKQVIGFAILGTDLTTNKVNERMLALYAKKIQMADEHLERFAYITSHDLKEPLRNVSYYTTKLERELGPLMKNQAREYFGFITEGVNRMYNLIESIRHVSDIHNGKEQRAVIDLSKLIEHVEQRLDALIKSKRAFIQKAKLPKIIGDPTHFELLFFNLIENAVKYNKSPLPKIKICCTIEERQFIFSIKDNGIGVEPEFYEYIFKMFKRLHSRADYDGVGMGLAICKSVVEKNGGQIWIEKNEFDGVTVKFSIPKVKGYSQPLKQLELAAKVV